MIYSTQDSAQKLEGKRKERISLTLSEVETRNEIRYFGTTGGAFRYRHTEYNIVTDTDNDTEWMVPNDFFRYT